MRPVLLALLAACTLQASVAAASTSHAGWPKINGFLAMNKNDASRPLDARPGHDPFGGKDDTYSCDGVHATGACQRRFVRQGDGRVVTSRKGHNELLGGHGSDTIHAGPWGDVLWGDYKPSGQGSGQRDRITGGAGSDFIYASHGRNTIRAGGGKDYVKAHFGRGSIDCGGGHDQLYISHKAQRHYTIRHCERISHKSLGF